MMQQWSVFQLNFGVRQGSVLSLALFAVYLDDLSNLFILERHKLVILYASDILIIAPSITGLERMLHACERELHWHCMRIGPRCDINCAKTVSLTGKDLPWVTDIRYLGIYIFRSRLFKCSLDMAKRSFYRAANAVFGKIGMPFAEASLFFSKFFSSLLRSTTLESFSDVHNRA